jgi:hypothetical protein
MIPGTRRRAGENKPFTAPRRRALSMCPGQPSGPASSYPRSVVQVHLSSLHEGDPRALVPCPLFSKSETRLYDGLQSEFLLHSVRHPIANRVVDVEPSTEEAYEGEQAQSPNWMYYLVSSPFQPYTHRSLLLTLVTLTASKPSQTLFPSGLLRDTYRSPCWP